MQEMILLQQKVDETIRALGGYFRPLSGLARLIEEVGEVGEALETGDELSFQAELVDVLMISTCLANQYVTDLAQQHQQLGTMEDEGQGSFYRLVHEAGQVARVMNGYEGDKPPKQTEDIIPIGMSLARLQRELFRLVRPHGINLLQEIDRTNEKNLNRDRKRFALTRDPVTEATIDHFRSATGNTERLWGHRLMKVISRLRRTFKRLYRRSAGSCVAPGSKGLPDSSSKLRWNGRTVCGASKIKRMKSVGSLKSRHRCRLKKHRTGLMSTHRN
ncbi:nucleotide pyrophosphohydrolase [Exiguobacterium artemiae]